ncbi:calcium-binding protein [Tropicimonas marinistellae]|uniref:calcium-binding protein n=1 Tax=Tropicimonas marinistellae TaxID=1739787 RepID=UPI000836FA54|nr:calcium-binding protein [Tropicimonas marinistellae]
MARLSGTRFVDHIVGTNVADIIRGFGGNDILKGRGGNDDIRGSLGNDWIWGGHGNDKLSGGEGDDFLFGESGNDTLNGNDGDDALIGGDGNDGLKGGRGDDLLFGEQTDDRLVFAGPGADIAAGGSGDDTVVWDQASDGSDGLWDIAVGGNALTIDTTGEIASARPVSEDSDMLLLTVADADVAAILEAEIRARYDGVNYARLDSIGLVIAEFETVTIKLEGVAGYHAVLDADDFTGESLMEGLFSGTNGDDTLISLPGPDPLSPGDDDDDIFLGGDGNDEIRPDPIEYVSREPPWGTGTGNHIIFGQGGDDDVITGFGDDFIYGGTGNDHINSAHGNDTLVGGAGNDVLWASYGNDTLIGGAGNDNLYGGHWDTGFTNTYSGGSGDDVLFASAGDDVMEGGAGADTFRYMSDRDFLGRGGHDTITDYEQEDTILFIGGFGVESVAQVGSDVVLSMGPDSDLTVLNTTIDLVLDDIAGWYDGPVIS